ncbi:hypothetical protein B5M47_01590 [candidate division CPR3 bacterium 4484_211]|uniref:DUF2304 domain-containing protein n=1 Tax=candidate division CPR3 bacterium 4484_211 TaxID=1968527 RepID=A0A1W9NYQ7_UNCC3|nr:MAG: hypothetical protein B5M47_01590 [candidate division CPR3 bacterium 4484_211]
MIILKLLITPLVVLLLAQVWSEFKSSRLGLFWFFFWFIAWLTVEVILFFPQVTTFLAKILGVERGIDSIIYLSIVALFYLTFRIYLKIENLNRKISKLAQKDALKKADR